MKQLIHMFEKVQPSVISFDWSEYLENLYHFLVELKNILPVTIYLWHYFKFIHLDDVIKLH